MVVSSADLYSDLDPEICPFHCHLGSGNPEMEKRDIRGLVVLGSHAGAGHSGAVSEMWLDTQIRVLWQHSKASNNKFP